MFVMVVIGMVIGLRNTTCTTILQYELRFIRDHTDMLVLPLYIFTFKFELCFALCLFLPYVCARAC